MKVGAVTIGQAPRTDVTCDLIPIFGGKIDLLQRGGLDGLTSDDILKFAPSDRDYVLVSKLLDGSSVTFAEKYILPRLQQAIRDLEAEGAELIVFFVPGLSRTLSERLFPLFTLAISYTALSLC